MSPDAGTTGPVGAQLPLRRPGASVVPLDDNVAVYDEVGQLLILLNVSAAAVWERCDGTATVDDLGRALAAAYPGAPSDIVEDVRRTVEKLCALGLVVDARR
jgi:hypothetical protein